MTDRRPPFFILGAHGSGSTLLRLMLDSHENLAVPPETGVMRLVTAHRWVPFWMLGGEWHEHLDLSSEELDRRLAEFYGGLFDRFATGRGKTRWGEKTPFHVWHVEEIRRVFPGAVFVVIVRHPFGSIASAVRRFDRRLPRATQHWVNSTRELLRQAATHGDDMCFLRYEDLLEEPETTLRELLDWLGEPWSDRVLAHHEVQRRREGGGRVVEGGTRSTDAVDPTRTKRWRKWLDDDKRRYVEEQTLPWARVLGYGDDPDVPLQRLAQEQAGRRRVALGAEIAARFDTFPDLDRAAPTVPRADDLILPRGPRRRRKALRRAASGRSPAARQLFDRLPAGVQRSILDARRRRRG